MCRYTHAIASRRTCGWLWVIVKRAREGPGRAARPDKERERLRSERAALALFPTLRTFPFGTLSLFRRGALSTHHVHPHGLAGRRPVRPWPGRPAVPGRVQVGRAPAPAGPGAGEERRECESRALSAASLTVHDPSAAQRACVVGARRCGRMSAVGPRAEAREKNSTRRAHRSMPRPPFLNPRPLPLSSALSPSTGVPHPRPQGGRVHLPQRQVPAVAVRGGDAAHVLFGKRERERREREKGERAEG